MTIEKKENQMGNEKLIMTLTSEQFNALYDARTMFGYKYNLGVIHIFHKGKDKGWKLTSSDGHVLVQVDTDYIGDWDGDIYMFHDKVFTPPKRAIKSETVQIFAIKNIPVISYIKKNFTMQCIIELEKKDFPDFKSIVLDNIGKTKYQFGINTDYLPKGKCTINVKELTNNGNDIYHIKSKDGYTKYIMSMKIDEEDKVELGAW